MNFPNQLKIFFVWFAIFLPTVFVAAVTQNDLAIYLFWFLLIVIGLIMLKDISADAFYSLMSVSWPSTPFRVKNSKVVYSAGGADSNPHYNTYFEIEYVVNLKKYDLLCNEFNIPTHQTEAEAKSYIQEVVSGTKGKVVYYHPERHEIAYIKPGLKFRHILGAAVALVLIIVPVLSFLKVIVWRDHM